MKFALRDYQRDAIRGDNEQPGIHNFLYRDNNFSGIVVLPTGAGKTFTLVAYLESLRRERAKRGDDVRFIWLAHREELVEQAADTFRKVNPNAYVTSWTARKITLDTGEKIMGPKDAHGHVIVGMINSTKLLAESIELVARGEGCTYVVVIDECHHYAIPHNTRDKYTNMYHRLMLDLQKIKVKGRHVIEKLIGLTATPERLDGRKLGFDDIAYKISFIEMVRRGYLAKPILREMRSDQYAKLDVRGGEFTNKSLERLNTPARNLKIAMELVDKRWMYGKTIVFCCSRAHCAALLQTIEKYAKKRNLREIPIRLIDGTASRLQRAELRNWLDAGPPREFKILLNCMVYTEGFDCPSLNSVLLARPTMSQSLWMQMVGRGARIIKAQATYPKSFFTEYPPSGETGVFKSAKDPALVAVGKTLEEIPGTVPKIKVERAIKDQFNLTVVSDDITRFSILVKDWELQVSPEAADDKVRQKKKADKAHKKKVKDKLKDKKEIKRVEAKLEDAQLVNVRGILVVSTLKSARIGIPMDDDRMDGVRALIEFTKGCWIDWVDHTPTCKRPLAKNGDRMCNCPSRKIFDKDMFTQSYTYCMTSGALPLAVWTKIMWSYYFYEIRDQKKMLEKGTQKLVDTWKWIGLQTITDQMKKSSRVRVRKDLEQAARDNAAFNATYSGRKEILELFTKVFRHSMQNKLAVATVSALNGVHSRIIKINAKDRRLLITTDIEIEGERSEWIRKLFVFRETLTQSMQHVIGDNCCAVHAVSQGSSLAQQDGHSFRGPNYQKQALPSAPNLPDTQV